MNSIMIREANSSDLSKIVEVEKAESLIKYPNPDLGISSDDILAIGFDEDRVAKYRARFLENSNGHMWLAVIDDMLAGFVAVTKEPDNLHLRKLYVRSEYQRKGMGSALLETAEQWLGSTGPYLLSVASYDQAALAFYRRHGYAISGSRPIDETTVSATGTVIPETLMVKYIE